MQMSMSTAKKNEYRLDYSFIGGGCEIQYLGRYVAAKARVSVLSPSTCNALPFLKYGDRYTWELLLGPNQGADAFDMSVRGMLSFAFGANLRSLHQ